MSTPHQIIESELGSPTPHNKRHICLSCADHLRLLGCVSKSISSWAPPVSRGPHSHWYILILETQLIKMLIPQDSTAHDLRNPSPRRPTVSTFESHQRLVNKLYSPRALQTREIYFSGLNKFSNRQPPLRVHIGSLKIPKLFYFLI